MYIDLQARESPNCLLLCFEDLIKNKKAHIAVIARFLKASTASVSVATVDQEESHIVNEVFPMTQVPLCKCHCVPP
mgnify:FL=1